MVSQVPRFWVPAVQSPPLMGKDPAWTVLPVLEDQSIKIFKSKKMGRLVVGMVKKGRQMLMIFSCFLM